MFNEEEMIKLCQELGIDLKDFHNERWILSWNLKMY